MARSIPHPNSPRAFALAASLGGALFATALPAQAEDADKPISQLGLDPATPQAAALPGGTAPSFGVAPTKEGDWRFDFHGLLTAPLRAGFNTRDNPREGQSKNVLHSPPDSDRAFVANYQTLGYLVRDRMVLLQPRRKTEVFRVDADKNIVAPVDDPQALREAIAFYSAASYVFHSGLYRDEEQTPPEQRAALPRGRHGS